MLSTRSSLAVLFVALATPALADVVVIRATGPSAAHYVAGKTLPDAARITLQKGDQIVLLDAHGTRTLSGPGSFAASDTATASGSSLIALASNIADRRNRVGAVRNLPTGSLPVRPNIFLVDTTAPGNVCIVDPAGVTLWRGATDSAGSSSIIAPSGARATVSWIKGQSTQPWPAKLPVTAAGTYQLTDGTKPGASVAITFQLLPEPPADLPQLAQALIGHGCTAQIDVMIATTGTKAG